VPGLRSIEDLFFNNFFLNYFLIVFPAAFDGNAVTPGLRSIEELLKEPTHPDGMILKKKSPHTQRVCLQNNFTT